MTGKQLNVSSRKALPAKIDNRPITATTGSIGTIEACYIDHIRSRGVKNKALIKKTPKMKRNKISFLREKPYRRHRQPADTCPKTVLF